MADCALAGDGLLPLGLWGWGVPGRWMAALARVGSRYFCGRSNTFPIVSGLYL